MKLIIDSLRRNFLAGLLIIIPFGLTIIILFKLGKWIIRLVSAAPARFLIEPLSELSPLLLFQRATFAIGIAKTVLIAIIAGEIARNNVGRKFLGFAEGLISEIPLATTVYTAGKQQSKLPFTASDLMV
jgi:uncharacterized membrane protein